MNRTPQSSTDHGLHREEAAQCTASSYLEGDCGARAGRGSNSTSVIEYPLDKRREEFQEEGYLFSLLLAASFSPFWAVPERGSLCGISRYKR